jgi:hypothetical protein
VCEHCTVLDSILVSLVGRKVTDVIMKRVIAELHEPIENLAEPSSINHINCAVTH